MEYWFGVCSGALLITGIVVFGSNNIYLNSSKYTCTRYEIIGESPDRHEVCAVYERKEGV